MPVNNRNFKNPTVQAWESLRMFLQHFTERMTNFDNMVQRQGRDMGVDEVYNEIQRMKQQLDSIQNGLNLYNGTIPQENQGINPPNIQGESKLYKNKVRLSESQLHNVIKESVKKILNEMSPEVYAAYAQGRQQQADNTQDPNEKFKYQRKANQGVNTAQNAWDKQYGFSYNNGRNDWGEQTMGGTHNFIHNGNTNYGINYRGERPNWDGNGYTHTNLAYNPQSDTVWQGDGKGNSTVMPNDSNKEMGDNGAYSTARRMQNAKWSDVQQRIRQGR